ncbi:unnamed protein product [Gongylonema pulchrum]|uniref:Transposase n=1 Tax=Gongylonema pulchrum TaxID=637853 RepID=A0A183DZH5_9BILA|nr:unnamed protein product [Gongylonema pulchrum]
MRVLDMNQGQKYVCAADELCCQARAVNNEKPFIAMEVDNAGLNLKTMKKSDGSYPVWFSQRKIRRKKREQNIKQKAKKRKAKKNRC